MHGTHSANWATRAPRPSIVCHKLRYSLNVPPHSQFHQLLLRYPEVSDGILSLHHILPVLPVLYTQNTSNVRLPAQMHKNNLCQLLPMRRSSSLWALYSVLKGVVFTIHSFGLPFSPNPSSSSFWGTPRYSLALWDKQYLQCFLHLSLLQVKITVYLHRDVCRTHPDQMPHQLNWSSVNVKKQAPHLVLRVSQTQWILNLVTCTHELVLTSGECWSTCDQLRLQTQFLLHPNSVLEELHHCIWNHSLGANLLLYLQKAEMQCWHHQTGHSLGVSRDSAHEGLDSSSTGNPFLCSTLWDRSTHLLQIYKAQVDITVCNSEEQVHCPQNVIHVALFNNRCITLVLSVIVEIIVTL